MPVVIDLYCGVGGLSLGAAQAGFRVAACVDSNDRALAAHAVNFPRSAHVSSDVACLSGTRLLAKAGVPRGGLDGLIGGPPCQGFSSMGKRRPDDERNQMCVHFVRLVAETRPRFFVMENVPGILMREYAPFLEAVFAPLRTKYHILPPLRVCAADAGAPTSRTRVFFLGFREDEFGPVDYRADVTSNCAPSVRIALSGLPASIPNEWRSNPLGRHRIAKTAHSERLGRMYYEHPDGIGQDEALRLLSRGIVLGHISTAHSPELLMRYDQLRPGETDHTTGSTRLIATGYCPTLRAGTDVTRGAFQAVRPIHYRYPRVITPREAARLQGFPDWFQFDRTKWHAFRQIGNSVPPPLARAVLAPIARLVA